MDSTRLAELLVLFQKAEKNQWNPANTFKDFGFKKDDFAILLGLFTYSIFHLSVISKFLHREDSQAEMVVPQQFDADWPKKCGYERTIGFSLGRLGMTVDFLVRSY